MSVEQRLPAYPLSLPTHSLPLYQHPHKEALCLTLRDEKVDDIINGTAVQPVIHSDSSIISQPRQMTDGRLFSSFLLVRIASALRSQPCRWLFCHPPPPRPGGPPDGEAVGKCNEEGRVLGSDCLHLQPSSPRLLAS